MSETLNLKQKQLLNLIKPISIKSFKISIRCKKYNLFHFSTKPCIFATFWAKTSAHLEAVR